MTPRGLGKRAAALYCGLSLAMFEAQVAAGLLPAPIRFKVRNRVARVWDRKALDDSLDALSGRYRMPPLKAAVGEAERRTRGRADALRHPTP